MTSVFSAVFQMTYVTMTMTMTMTKSWWGGKWKLVLKSPLSFPFPVKFHFHFLESFLIFLVWSPKRRERVEHCLLTKPGVQTHVSPQSSDMHAELVFYTYKVFSSPTAISGSHLPGINRTLHAITVCIWEGHAHLYKKKRPEDMKRPAGKMVGRQMQSLCEIPNAGTELSTAGWTKPGVWSS